MRHFLTLWLIIFFVLNLTCALNIQRFARDVKTTTAPTKYPTTEAGVHFNAPGYTPAPNYIPAKSGLLKKCDPCPTGIKCVPPIQCPAHVRLQLNKPQACDLPGNDHGFCCTTGQNHTGPINHSSKRTAAKPQGEIIQSMSSSVLKARDEMLNLINKENLMRDVELGEPQFFHNMVFRGSPFIDTMKSVSMTHKAMEEIMATRIFKEKEQIPVEDFQLNHLSEIFDGTPMEKSCESAQVNCPSPHMRYRTEDGSCNNFDPKKSKWASAGQPMERLLPPAYEDGIWSPRLTSADGSQLPSARLVSRILLDDVHRPHSKYNLLVMQFGQLISHDVTQSASITKGDGKGVTCCSKDGSRMLPPQESHYGCFPIHVDKNDHFYQTFKQGCINFVRSSLVPNTDCKMGYGKQLSKVSHYLDGSVFYGSDINTQTEVRSFKNGKLRMFDDFGRDLLPLSKEKDACLTMKKGSACFFAGDGRCNQIITLTALHQLFAREHNRIADILSHLNPHWMDEVIFQEARRIVIAEFQHITYNEWLPIIVGSKTMQRFSLNVHSHGYSPDYDPEVKASITNEFSGAAFRFGHSAVDGKLHVLREDAIDEIIDIPEVMFNPARLRQRHFYDEILKTLTHQPMQEVDASISKGLSRYLFRGGNPFGLDLAALNIQRGRDQGLGAYNDYLEVGGHKRIEDFSLFGDLIGHKLASVYKSPDDIDLWIGGLLEAGEGDALIGPTFGDIIADQFSRFRKGDRYFYEHGPDVNPGHFTIQQLDEIRKVSMARIICDNADHISLVEQAPAAFYIPHHPGNEPIACKSNAIPFMDLSKWKE